MAQKGSRLIVPATAVSAVVIVAAWFPFSTLLGQSAQLNSTARQISLINRETHTLVAQQRALSTKQAETELARQEYQLVRPGQRLIQILSNGSSTHSIDTGDPGTQPLVAPVNASGLVPQNPSAPASKSGGGGFWSRVERTFEFWR